MGKRLQDIFDEGLKAEALGDLKSAIIAYKKITLEYDDFIPAYVKLAEVFAKLGFYDDAIEVYKDCLAINDDVAEIYVSYLNLLYDLARLDDALELLEVANYLGFNALDLYIISGKVYADLGNDKKALENYNIALEKYPDNPVIIGLLSAVYMKMNKCNKALRFANRAVKLDDNLAFVYVNFAKIYLTLGEFEKAQEACYKAIDTEFLCAKDYLDLAMVMDDCDLSMVATDIVANACAKMPHNSVLLSALASRYLLFDELEKAEEYSMKALNEDDKNPLAHNILGLILLAKGEDVVFAAQCFQKAVLVDSNSEKSNRNLFYAWGKLIKYGFYEKADEIYRWWADFAPYNPFVRHMSNILKKDDREKTPQEFIRIMSSYFASSDSFGIDVSDYNVNRVVFDALEYVFEDAKEKLKVLELGVGFGSLSKVLKPYAKLDEYTGVDISKDMIKIAGSVAQYDNLVESEYINFFKNNNERYDLICAVDALNYVGDLRYIVAYIAKRLSYDGVIVVALEKITDEDLHGAFLTVDGYYQYEEEYVKSVFRENGLKIIKSETVSYYKRDGADVDSIRIIAKG
jgi:predicted TPR repeat methyltransferase